MFVYQVKAYLRPVLNLFSHKPFLILTHLIDDGSTDGSGKSVINMPKGSERVTVHQDNGGLSIARNTGISIAQRRILYMIDSDDTIHRIF